MALAPYTIRYEDEALIIVEKSAGLLVIPTPKGETNTLTDLLNRELDGRGISVNAYACHRLDRETSGLIIYAKGKKIQQLMMDAFRRRRVKKAYIALVQGFVKRAAGILHGKIYNRNKCREEDAITKYHVIDRRGRFTVVEVEPVTGRTNQIRIHFAALGHPLVGETVYALRRDATVKAKRAMLHAARLEFMHPVSQRALSFRSELPEDMKNLLQPNRHKERKP